MYVCMYVCMYVWMDGWMDGWMDVWMDGWMAYFGNWQGLGMNLARKSNSGAADEHFGGSWKRY